MTGQTDNLDDILESNSKRNFNKILSDAVLLNDSAAMSELQRLIFNNELTSAEIKELIATCRANVKDNQRHLFTELFNDSLRTDGITENNLTNDYAKTCLGCMFRAGIGVEMNVSTAEKIFNSLPQNVWALNCLGKLNHDNFKKEEAAKRYTIAAAKGSNAARISYAKICESNGALDSIQYSIAAEWYYAVINSRTASDAQKDQAKLNVAVLLLQKGEGSKTVDPEDEAIRFFLEIFKSRSVEDKLYIVTCLHEKNTFKSKYYAAILADHLPEKQKNSGLVEALLYSDVDEFLSFMRDDKYFEEPIKQEYCAKITSDADLRKQVKNFANQEYLNAFLLERIKFRLLPSEHVKHPTIGSTISFLESMYASVPGYGEACLAIAKHLLKDQPGNYNVFKNAEKYLKMGIAAGNESCQTVLEAALYNRVNYCLEKNDIENALQFFNEISEDMQVYGKACQSIAIFKIQAKNDVTAFEEAIPYLEKGIKAGSEECMDFYCRRVYQFVDAAQKAAFDKSAGIKINADTVNTFRQAYENSAPYKEHLLQQFAKKYHLTHDEIESHWSGKVFGSGGTIVEVDGKPIKLQHGIAQLYDALSNSNITVDAKLKIFKDTLADSNKRYDGFGIFKSAAIALVRDSEVTKCYEEAQQIVKCSL